MSTPATPPGGSSSLYYEDLPLGFRARSGPCEVEEAEILEFGRRFDPRPFHTDPEAARASVFGGLVAPGCLVFALRSRLMNQLQVPIAYLAGLGLEQMDLPRAVRPGDRLTLELECVGRRESQSRPDAGIVRFANTLLNQRNEIVLVMTAKVLVARRPLATT